MCTSCHRGIRLEGTGGTAGREHFVHELSDSETFEEHALTTLFSSPEQPLVGPVLEKGPLEYSQSMPLNSVAWIY